MNNASSDIVDSNDVLLTSDDWYSICYAAEYFRSSNISISSSSNCCSHDGAVPSVRDKDEGKTHSVTAHSIFHNATSDAVEINSANCSSSSSSNSNSNEPGAQHKDEVKGEDSEGGDEGKGGERGEGEEAMTVTDRMVLLQIIPIDLAQSFAGAQSKDKQLLPEDEMTRAAEGTDALQLKRYDCAKVNLKATQPTNDPSSSSSIPSFSCADNLFSEKINSLQLERAADDGMESRDKLLGTINADVNAVVELKAAAAVADADIRKQEFFKMQTLRTSSLFQFSPSTDAKLVRLSGKHLNTSGVVGLVHLEKLLLLLDQMEQVRQVNRMLERRCAFLKDVQTLVKYQNTALFSEKRLPHDVDRKLHLSVTNHHSKYSYRGGIKNMSFDSTVLNDAEVILTASRLQEQSMTSKLDAGAGDFDSVERNQNGGGKTKVAVEKTTTKFERKKSKKLQAKWEQVKKVFSGKTEVPSKSKDDTVLLTTSTREPLEKEDRIKTKQKRHSTIVCPLMTDDFIGVFPRKDETGVKCGGQGSPGSAKSEPIGSEDDERIGSNVLEKQCRRIRRSCSASSLLSATERKEDEVEAFLFPGLSDAGKCKEVNRTKSRATSNVAGPHRTSSSPPPPPRSSDASDIHKSLSRSRSLKSGFRETTQIEGSWKSLPSSPVEEGNGNGEAPPSTVAGVQQQHTPHGAEAAGRKARAAWGKVKDIIHTKRESLKIKGHHHKDEGHHQKGEGHHKGESHLKCEGNQKGKSTTNGTDDGSHNRDDARSGKDVSSSACSGFDVEEDCHAEKRRQESLSPNRRHDLKAKDQSLSPKRTPCHHGGEAGQDNSNDGSHVKRSKENESTTKRSRVSNKAAKKIKDMGRAKSVDTSVVKFTDDFITRMEEWEEKKKIISASSSSKKSNVSEVHSSDPRGSEPLPSGLEGVEQLSESFSKTVENWKRVRGGREKSDRDGRGRKTESRSMSRERGKSSQRMEQELQKIEKKEQKLETELQKLTEMKQKLVMNSGRDVRNTTEHGTNEFRKVKDRNDDLDSKNKDTDPPSGVVHREPAVKVMETTPAVHLSSSSSSIRIGIDETNDGMDFESGSSFKEIGLQVELIKEEEQEKQLDATIKKLEKEIEKKNEMMSTMDNEADQMREKIEKLQKEKEKQSAAAVKQFDSIEVQTTKEEILTSCAFTQTDWKEGEGDDVTRENFLIVNSCHQQTLPKQSTHHSSSASKCRKLSAPSCLSFLTDDDDDNGFLMTTPSAFRPICYSDRTPGRLEPAILSNAPCIDSAEGGTIRRFKPIIVRSSEDLDSGRSGGALCSSSAHEKRSAMMFGGGFTAKEIEQISTEFQINSILNSERTENRRKTEDRELSVTKNSRSLTSTSTSTLPHPHLLPSHHGLLKQRSGDVRLNSSCETQPDDTTVTSSIHVTADNSWNKSENTKWSEEDSDAMTTRGRAQSDCTRLSKSKTLPDHRSCRAAATMFCKSPSPLFVRNLKSAAELMADSERRRPRFLMRPSSETMARRTRATSSDASSVVGMRSFLSTGWTRNTDRLDTSVQNPREGRRLCEQDDASKIKSIDSDNALGTQSVAKKPRIPSCSSIGGVGGMTLDLTAKQVPYRTFALCSMTSSAAALADDSDHSLFVSEQSSTDSTNEAIRDRRQETNGHHVVKATTFYVTASSSSSSMMSTSKDSNTCSPMLRIQAIPTNMIDLEVTTKQKEIESVVAEAAKVKDEPVPVPVPARRRQKRNLSADSSEQFPPTEFRKRTGVSCNSELRISAEQKTAAEDQILLPRTKIKFLEGGWLNKSRKFFKSSK